MDKNTFVSLLDKQGITISEKQLDQFERYYELLIEWNEKINLTAITAKEEVYLKHFYDSLTASFYYKLGNELVCDVGAGAGFPSIPLKIAFPNIKLTIVDSLNKRINFLNNLAAELDLKDVKFVHDRAETFGQNKDYRHKYDIVMARAVARMSVLLELCLPLVKENGTFIAMKGANSRAEMADAEKAIKVLGGKVKNVHEFLLPIEESERAIIEISKVKNTPKKYPRKPGLPNKSPIK